MWNVVHQWGDALYKAQEVTSLDVDQENTNRLQVPLDLSEAPKLLIGEDHVISGHLIEAYENNH